MTTPKNYVYSRTHEWVQYLEDGTALTGLTDFAQKSLSDLVFINMPAEGDAVASGEPYADIESVKAVSDIYSQVSGTIIATNGDVDNEPGKINEDPYGAWIIKIGGISDKAALMGAEEYDKFCEEEEA